MEVEDSKPASKTVGTLELGLELKDLSSILAGLEQIKVAAQEAASAVASIGGAALTSGPAPEFAAAELVADDTPKLILAELQAMRAELAALREHSGAKLDRQLPPPLGAKHGHWQFAVGMPARWVESELPTYDPDTGALTYPTQAEAPAIHEARS